MKRLVAVVMLFGLALTGCSTIPTSGPVVTGDQVGQDAGNQFIRVIARPPVDGMTPSQIITGFLEASASFDADHAIARQYLTPEANQSWDPSAGVQAYEGALDVKETGTSLLISATKAGSISEDGRYQVAEPGAELVAWFDVAQVNGQWRISRAPDDLILSLSDIDRAYRTYNVYFFNPDYSMLVPDARTIPVSDSGVATTLVRRLIGGPTEWLAPAVRTGFPEGVALNIDAVLVENGVARVDLTSNIRLADEKAQISLCEQLVWTLKQLPEVSSVEITAAGQPLTIPGVQSPQPVDAWPGVNPDGTHTIQVGYGISNGRAVKLTENSIAAVRGAAGTGEQELAEIAISADEFNLAAVSTDSKLLLTTVAEGSTFSTVEGLESVSEPVIDRSNDVWVIDAALGPQLVSKEGKSKAITVDGLPPKTSVLKLVPSLDGTRVAMITRNKSRSTLLLGRVVARGGQITVEAPIRVETTLAQADDVAWSSADTLEVLGGDGAGVNQAFSVNIARALVRGQGAPSDPVSIAAAPGTPVLIGSADNKTYDLKAGTWTARYSASSPTYPF